MDDRVQTHLENLYSSDKETQNSAYYGLMELTEKPIDWAYDVWDEMVENLAHEDNHLRAIAAQVLCNLAAKSDPENRISQDFAALLAGTKDPQFVTARHTLQSLWKIGLAGEAQKQQLLAGLAQRYEECISEKNATLIRYDIIEALRKLYDAEPDETIREKALALIETEEDPKYRKKYVGVWKN